MREFLAKQTADGRFMDEGSISLDVQKALDKLESFQMVEHGDHYLKLIQAAVQFEATDAQILLGVTFGELVFTCPGESLEGLDQLPLALLGRTDYPSRGLKHLGVGIRAALGRVRSVELLLDNEIILQLGQSRDTRFSLPALEPKTVVELRVRLYRGSFMQRLFDRVLRASESRVSVTETVFSPIPITIDTRPIERGWFRGAEPPKARRFAYKAPFYVLEAYFGTQNKKLPEFPFPLVSHQRFAPLEDGFQEWRIAERWYREHPASPTLYRWRDDMVTQEAFELSRKQSLVQCTVAAAISSDQSEKAEIRCVVDGVLTAAKYKRLGVPGLKVVISGEGLTTDLSDFKIVENQAFEDRIDALAPYVESVGRKLETLFGGVERYLTDLAFDRPRL